MTSTPSILILTLSSGENELPACREALSRQGITTWEHTLIEGLPNKVAHETLYATIMESRDRFEIFVKLDADMILADTTALGRIVAEFRSDPELDHLVVAVADWMTGTDMIGIHAFSNRVIWTSSGEDLYVDPDPERPGHKTVVYHPEPPLVHHAPDPSPFQAFHFGAHRAIQAIQRHRAMADRRPDNAALQWSYLVRVWRHFQQTRDQRLGLAVMAAELVLRGDLQETANEYGDQALIMEFDRWRELPPDQLERVLRPGWRGPLRRSVRWLKSLGVAFAARVVQRGVRDGAARCARRLVAPDTLRRRVFISRAGRPPAW